MEQDQTHKGQTGSKPDHDSHEESDAGHPPFSSDLRSFLNHLFSTNYIGYWLSGAALCCLFIWFAAMNIKPIWWGCIGVILVADLVIFAIFYVANKRSELPTAPASQPSTTTKAAARAELRITGPERVRSSATNAAHWRVTVTNRGSAPARNVKMRLCKMTPPPRAGGFDHFPYPVKRLHDARQFACQISPADSETFEPLSTWRNPDHLVAEGLDPTRDQFRGQIVVLPDERWEMDYEVTSDDAPRIAFSLIMRIVNGDPSLSLLDDVVSARTLPVEIRRVLPPDQQKLVADKLPYFNGLCVVESEDAQEPYNFGRDLENALKRGGWACTLIRSKLGKPNYSLQVTISRKHCIGAGTRGSGMTNEVDASLLSPVGTPGAAIALHGALSSLGLMDTEKIIADDLDSRDEIRLRVGMGPGSHLLPS
jgi:hypothetical protein